jgi:MFS family permease
MTTWFSASAVIPQLRAEWSLTSTAAAWLTIAVQLGFVAGAVLSSLFNVADVHAPKHVIVAGASGAAVANGLILLAGSATPALPLRFLTGFFLAGVYPPALKLMATWFRRKRGTALGIMVGALTVGSAAPHLVNGLGGLRWSVVIGATSVLTLAGALLVAVAVSEGPFPFPRAAFDPRRIKSALGDRGVRLASLGYFGHMWELYAMWAWFVVFFAAHERQVGSGAGNTAAFAAFAVIGIGGIGCWIGGIAGDRWGREATTITLMAVSGTCALLVGLLFDAPTWLLLAVSLVWGVAVVGDSAQFSTLVTELADQTYVGTALTLQLALGFTLTVVTIWLIPSMERTVGWEWAFALLAPGPALGILSMWRLSVYEKSRAPAPTGSGA